jgi:hypothetical protein
MQRQKALSSTGYADKTVTTSLSDMTGNPIAGTAGQYQDTALKQAMALLKDENSYSVMNTIQNVSGNIVQQEVKRAQSQLEQIPAYKTYRESDPSAVKTFQYWDSALQTWKDIKATQEEMNLATQEINKKFNQITGTFNLPAGGRVPWYAIEQGFKPQDQLSGGVIGGYGGVGYLGQGGGPNGTFLSPGYGGSGYLGQGSGPNSMVGALGSRGLLSGPSSGTFGERGTNWGMAGGSGLAPLTSNDLGLGSSSSITTTQPINITIPVNITLDGVVVGSTVNKQITERTTTARRTSAGGGGGRSYLP